MAWMSGNPVSPGTFVVIDGNEAYHRANTQSETLQQAAIDYGNESQNQQSREVQVFEITSGGIGSPQTFTVPYVPPPPLVHLDWRQSWPTTEPTPWVDVLDNGSHFSAPNPEGWTLEKCARDYGDAPVPGYEPPTPICENREPHDIQIREISASMGNGPWSEFNVPMPPEE